MFEIFSSSVLLLSGSLWAQSPSPSPSPDKGSLVPPVTFTKENNKLVVVHWPDGREATVTAYHGPTSVLHATVQVTENLCNDHAGMICTFDTAYSLNNVKLVWTKHPDASKINHVVKIKYPGQQNDQTQELIESPVILSSARTVAPNLTKDMPNDRFTCPDYSWVPGGSVQSPPAKALVSHWNNEYMFPNAETGVSENHSESGMLDVDLTKTPDGKMELSHVRHWVTKFSGIPANIGETMSLFFKPDPSADNLCQITLKPKFAELQAALNMNMEKAAKEPGEFYVYQSDELLSFAKQFRTYLDNLNYVNSMETVDGKMVNYYKEMEAE